ncbi:MAG TPA: hypothetical protein VGK33_06550 [Chloroflexota bacterium]
MMVAAHTYDLRAAQAQGMQTAFVKRPREWGPDGAAEPIGDDHFDLVVADLEQLAQQLSFRAQSPAPTRSACRQS